MSLRSRTYERVHSIKDNNRLISLGVLMIFYMPLSSISRLTLIELGSNSSPVILLYMAMMSSQVVSKWVVAS